MKFEVNNRVHWNDPEDGLCSGEGVIVAINGEVFSLSMDSGSEVEALEGELQAI